MPPAAFRPSADHALAAAVGLALCGAALAATAPHGIGLASDSGAYLAGADHLAAGRGYLTYTGEPIAVFPPLYATCIAVLHRAGLGLHAAARLLNAVAVGAVPLLARPVFAAYCESRWLVRAGLLSLLGAVPLYNVATMAWSDAGFVMLVLAFVVAFAPALRGGDWQRLALAGGIAALAGLQRYIGGACVILGAAALLALDVGRPLAVRVRRTVLFATVGAAPMVIWLVRNVARTGAPTGARSAAYFTLAQNAERALMTVSDWFATPALPARWVAGAAVLLAAGAWPAAEAWRDRRAPTADADDGRVLRMLGGTFTLLYVVLLVSAASSVAVAQLRDRFLAPVFVFAVAGLFRHLDRAGRTGDVGRTGVMLLVVVWLAFTGVRAYAWLAVSATRGIGPYNRAEWRDSETLRAATRLPADALLVSNAPDALFLLTGRSAGWTPGRHAEEMTQVRDRLHSSPAPTFVVWFAPMHRDYLAPLAEVRAGLDLRPIQGFADGAIFAGAAVP